MPDQASFSERIAARRVLWWDAPRPGGPRSLGDGAHRLRERRALRSRDDPDRTWRCCAFWQRTLLDKRNAREFAIRHGCRLPELYWCGAPHSRPPLHALPEELVIRPARGMGRRGVRVFSEGKELLWGGPGGREGIGAALSLRERLRRRAPTLVEELVRPQEGAGLPLEVKCHTFGSEVAALEVIERRAARDIAQRYYTPEWEPIDDPMRTGVAEAEPREAPACHGELLDRAAVLGGALGTYMRIDFFAGEAGCVFNEFSCTPYPGTGWTPYAERLFGRAWAERAPDAS